MRGVLIIFIVAIAVVAYMLLAPAAIEGVGEAVIDIGDLSESEEANIEAFYTALFVRVPLVAFLGACAIGIAWYIRRQQTTGVQ